MATQCSLSSLELRVQFCLLVCCTYPSSSTVNKEKNLIDQRASLRVDTRETQQINLRRRHWDFPHRNTSYRRSYPIRSFFASIVSTMAETTELIKLLADQIQVQRQQMVQQAKQMKQQAQFMERQSQQHREEMDQQAQQMQNLLKILDTQKLGTGEDDSSTHHPQLSTAAIPPFAAFDSTSELWPDYWSRFCTFVLYLSNAKHKFSSPIKLLLYTNNWLTWLLNKLRPRISTS